MTLSQQAQNTIADFKRRLEALPPEERAEAIKQMTENVSLLARDIKRAYSMLQSAKNKKDVESVVAYMKHEPQEHLTDYI